MTENNPTNGVAIVTGATGGMGSSSARRLAEQGWPLILCDLDAGRLEQTVKTLNGKGQKIEILACDIDDGGFIDRLIGLVADRPIGAVIHTAGLSPTMADASRFYRVNYEATWRLVEAIRPRMAEGSCAVLISSSSAFAMITPEFDAALDAIGPGEDSSPMLKFGDNAGLAYAISKRGVQRIVERQAMAFGKLGARIASISPGLIDTPMGRAEQKAHPIMDEMLARTPLGRYGTSDEIASAAVFLCSPDASYISGCDLKVDGGTLAAMKD